MFPIAMFLDHAIYTRGGDPVKETLHSVNCEKEINLSITSEDSQVPNVQNN